MVSKFPPDYMEQAQREPVKEHRGFIQRLFDKQIQRANEKALDHHAKQIQLHNNTANICIDNFELQTKVVELKYQRMILLLIIFILLGAIIKNVIKSI